MLRYVTPGFNYYHSIVKFLYLHVTMVPFAGNMQGYLKTSIIPDRNILPGFPFPLNQERDVSDIRCQRVEKRRDMGLQLQLRGVNVKKALHTLSL